MINPARLVRKLAGADHGTVAIETAFVAPVLVLMSLGAFQISSIVARQSELQTAMDEAQAIALASDPDTAEERTTLQQVIMASTGLPVGNVTVAEAYRCDNTTAYVTSNTCAVGTRVSRYVRIQITAVYTPIWTQFGVGEPLNFNQSRYVMYKQATKA